MVLLLPVLDSKGFGRDKAALMAKPHGGRHGQLFPTRMSQGEFAALHCGHVIYAVLISCFISFHVLIGLNVAWFVY